MSGPLTLHETTLGSYLRDCREAQGLTVRQLAKFVYYRRYQRQAVVEIESVEANQRTPYSDLLEGYCEFCQADPDICERLQNEATAGGKP